MSLNQTVALAESNGAALTLMDVVADSALAAEEEERFDLNLNTLLRQRRLEALESLSEAQRNSAA